MVRLFTTLYPEKNPRRRGEYEECLAKNLTCPVIDEVRILAEGGAMENLPAAPNLFSRPIRSRPLYADFFGWIHEVAAPHDISIIANSDIFFDESLAVASKVLRSGQCHALSRWDVLGDGALRLFDRNDSQDVWIFRGPVRAALRAAFPLGVPRCDNRLLHDLRRAGYEVLNPAFAVRACHLHAETRSEYPDSGKDFVSPPYAYLWPHNLYGLPRTLWHNVRNPKEKIGWKFDRRVVERTLPVRVLRRLGKRFNRL